MLEFPRIRRKPLKNRSSSESTAMPPSRTSSAAPAACHPQPADEQNLWAGVQLKNGNLPRSFRSDYRGPARRHPNQSEKESHFAKIRRADTESQKDLPAVFSRIRCCEQKRVATPPRTSPASPCKRTAAPVNLQHLIFCHARSTLTLR